MLYYDFYWINQELYWESSFFIQEEVVNAIEDFIKKECKVAKDKQRYDDIITSVVALSDVGVKENDLYELLSKYWHIDSRSEATEYINIRKTFGMAMYKIKITS